MDLSKAYKTILKDSFPSKMEISFYDTKENRQTLFYEKAEWLIGNEHRGLRYGENPDQEAAMYKLINGNLVIGETIMIQPGKYLLSDVDLLQSGKHPGKINIADADSGLNILKYFTDSPCAVIIKHNNPSGVALGKTLSQAYQRAYMADRIAAFGGCVVLNRAVDRETAELLCASYSEVVAAPEFESGVLELFNKKANLRVMQIGNIERLSSYVQESFIDFKSLIDGGIIIQKSFIAKNLSKNDFMPAQCSSKGTDYSIQRAPTDQEWEDIVFGWLVECGVTSNSVLYVKNGATVGIGTCEQDRVGVAEIARDKAYKKTADRLCWEKTKMPLSQLEDEHLKQEILAETKKICGGLLGSVMVSDAFFPFRDGIDVGLKEGVTAIVQPGGSLRDAECIEACNQAGAAMVFTGQRCFKH